MDDAESSHDAAIGQREKVLRRFCRLPYLHRPGVVERISHLVSC